MLDDYARVVVDAIAATGTFVRDATGPDRIEFGELVDYLTSLSGGRPESSGCRFPSARCTGLRPVSCARRSSPLTR